MWDRAGAKHVLSIELGANELFTRLRDQGLPTDRKYLFVIDGAKALRAAIKEVFGSHQPVQRCRNHKMRNVLDELPKEQHAQTLNLICAAWRACPMPMTESSDWSNWPALVMQSLRSAGAAAVDAAALAASGTLASVRAAAATSRVYEIVRPQNRK